MLETAATTYSDIGDDSELLRTSPSTLHSGSYSASLSERLIKDLIMAETKLAIMGRPLRYAWSHQSPIHRAAMKFANAGLARIPASMKYGAGWRLRRKKIPYSMVDGMNVVQIGAPFDTLASGRSRGAYLGMGVGASGNLLICEPLAASCTAFETFGREHLDCQVTVVNTGVWSEPGEIELHVDDKHPATNWSGDMVDYSDERKNEFRSVTVPSNTLDTIVREAGFPMPDLVSITTNWAELEILAGMSEMLANGLQYVSLALGKDNEDYRDNMSDLGYDVVGFDDRGVTYKRRT